LTFQVTAGFAELRELAERRWTVLLAIQYRHDPDLLRGDADDATNA
jgi:hypothetical protein